MNDFFPIPELSSTDRDLVLVSLWKNAMGYGHPVDDPVFAAHKKLVTMSARGLNDTFYLSDSPGSILGCTQQVCYTSQIYPSPLTKVTVPILLRPG